MTLSLLVIDDEVAEGIQSFILKLSQTQTEFFNVDIIDNDGKSLLKQSHNVNIFSNLPVVTVRLTNSSDSVEEGGVITVCTEIESPSEIERQFYIVGSLLPGTAEGIQCTHAHTHTHTHTHTHFIFLFVTASTDYLIDASLVYLLDGNTQSNCHDITTIDDSIPETNEYFTLSLTTFPIDSLLIIEPDNINFTVNDNDSKYQSNKIWAHYPDI